VTGVTGKIGRLFPATIARFSLVIVSLRQRSEQRFNHLRE
jgi:hypothetical protein